MSKSDIKVAILTRDPYFLFAARSLLGRDRRTRIVPDLIANDLAILRLKFSDVRSDVLIIDLDSFQNPSSITFYVDLIAFAQTYDNLRVMCLAELTLTSLPEALFQPSIRAVFAKSDLAHALHLAVHMMIDSPYSWVSEKVYLRCLKLGIPIDYHIVKPEKPHPDLSEAVARVVYLRVVIGLDNPDIDDELASAEGNAKTNMKRAYKSLEISGKESDKSMEFRVFEKLSDWWRKQRFQAE